MDQNNPVVSIFPRDPEDFSDKTRIKTVEDSLKILDERCDSADNNLHVLADRIELLGHKIDKLIDVLIGENSFRKYSMFNIKSEVDK